MRGVKSAELLHNLRSVGQAHSSDGWWREEVTFDFGGTKLAGQLRLRLLRASDDSGPQLVLD